MKESNIIFNTFSQTMNDLQVELAKLAQMAPSPLDLSFLIGYLSSLLPLDALTAMHSLLTDIVRHVQQGNLPPRNVLHILVAMKRKMLPPLEKEEEWLTQTQAQCSFIGLLIRGNLQAPYLQQSMVQPQTMKEEPSRVVCLICTLEILQMEACLFSCQHVYHQNCFQSYSKQRIFAKNLPIICPTDGCAIELPLEEVIPHISRELAEKLDEFMFQNYVEHNMKDTSWCPTPGCEVVFSFQEGMQEFRCPSCRRIYCLHCKHQVHKGLSCQQNKDMQAELAGLDEGDRKFIHLAKEAKFKQCPSCKFWVEKNQGCDHMTCRCKHEFCYICGGKYGNCHCDSEEDSERDSEEDSSEAQIDQVLLEQSSLILNQRRNIQNFRIDATQERSLARFVPPHYQLSSMLHSSVIDLSSSSEEASLENYFKAEGMQQSQPSLQFVMQGAKRTQRPYQAKMVESERPLHFPVRARLPAQTSSVVDITIKAFSSIRHHADITTTTPVKRPQFITYQHSELIPNRHNHSIGSVPKYNAPYSHRHDLSVNSPLRRAHQVEINPEISLSLPISRPKLKFNFTYSNPLPLNG